MRRRFAGALALGAGILLAGCGGGGDGGGQSSLPEPPARGNVLDEAGILSDQEEQRLSDLIDRRNGETDAARVAVLTVDGVDGDWEDWTRDVANSWGLGEGEASTGILLAVDMDERNLRIEVGDDAREAITDDDAEEIVSDVLEPPFRDEQYDRGLTETTNALYDQAQGLRAGTGSEGSGKLIAGIVIGAVVLFVGGVVLWVVLDVRKWRRIADEQIDEYLRENPGKEVSEETRRAFRKYRYHHRKPPEDLEAREERRRRAEEDGEPLDDAEDPRQYTQYASGFGAWLPLYMVAPSLYAGGGTPPPGAEGSSGASGSSFGGTPGGFTGGGASGSF